MLAQHSTLFVSDIHLSPNHSALHELFLAFLHGPARSADHLFILGDLFDVWVGQDIHSDYAKLIQHELQALHKHGVELFFMGGNRDFLLEKSFLNQCGCTKLRDPYYFSLQGVPTVLTHGDLLCTQDIPYQRYRRIVQNPLARFIFLKLPQKNRDNLGKKLRLKSQQYQQTQTATILDASPEAAENMMHKFKVHQLIHGHVHRPNIHDHPIDGRMGKRVVLGDWNTQGSVIISTPTQTALAIFDKSTGLTIQAAYTLEELAMPFAAV